MKNIVFTYSDIYHVNIGDYIQSISARQYCKDQDIIYLNRDELSSYKGEDAKVIMNGWFTYKPLSWRPSENMKPLFVSFHLNSEVIEKVLTSDTLLFLKSNEPIGCRDSYTVDTLKKKGINSYFSSCLTTTMGYKYPLKTANNKSDVYIVDPYSYMPNGKGIKELINTIFQFFRYIYPIIRLIKKYKESNRFRITLSKIGIGRLLLITKSYIILKDIVDKELLWNAKYITHVYEHNEYKTEEERFERAKEILQLYNSAAYVITSRIHAAFPCLGMGTPVVFIENKSADLKSSCRLDDIHKLLNVITVENGVVVDNFIGEKLSFRSVFFNKNYYSRFREDLIVKCNRFMTTS